MQKVKVKVKDSKSVVESAERESKREFVVLTPCAYPLVVSDDPCVVTGVTWCAQTQTYAAESSGIASQWVQKINAVLFFRFRGNDDPPDSTWTLSTPSTKDAITRSRLDGVGVVLGDYSTRSS